MKTTAEPVIVIIWLSYKQLCIAGGNLPKSILTFLQEKKKWEWGHKYYRGTEKGRKTEKRNKY
jgi:hypothetical protein